MALDFVTTISHQTNHRLKRDTYRLSQIRADLQNLERLYKYLQPTKKNKIARVRSLPSSVVEEILAMLAPNDETNPFRNKKTQWRNFTISLLLLHQGLRRGEIASLRADCLRHEYSSAENKDIYWLNVRQAELFDTRFDKPQIKNSQSERQIPVSNSLAKVVIHYIQNWRGRCKHGFLFGSSHGNPLSNRSFNYIFECVSGALSDIAREELYHKIQQKNVTLHNFRHTCAVVRLHNFMERNIEMALAEQLMREFFGWSKESQMPRRYAKAFYNTKLQDIWNDEFDERFESIHLTRSPLAEQTKNLETTISGAEHRPHLR